MTIRHGEATFAPDYSDLLEPLEHGTVARLGWVANDLAKIVGHGPTRDNDLNELIHHIHILQKAIMGQAAARAFPRQYRLLGEVMEGR